MFLKSDCLHNLSAFCCNYIFQFKCPSSIIIAGLSQCGKTTFKRQLLQQADSIYIQYIFNNGPFAKSYIAMDNGKNALRIWQVTFVEGIPEDIPSLFSINCRPGILILYDLMMNLSNDERILVLFTKVPHPL